MMSESRQSLASASRSVQVGEILRELLSEDPRYKSRWFSRASQTPGTEPSIAGVSRVIAEHLWDAGERSETERGLDRALRDRVRRALTGQMISPQTLRWFQEAFEMRPDDRARLDAALVLPTADPSTLRLRYRTLTVSEWHTIGSDRKPASHRTAQVVEALEDGIDEVQIMFDDGAVSLDVVHGGRVSGFVSQVKDALGVYEAKLKLLHPLSRGEVATIVYEWGFAYSHVSEPYFRRAAFEKTVKNVEIGVQFDRGNPPAQVFWSTWGTLDGAPSNRERVVLSEDASVRGFVPVLKDSVVGFEWIW